MLAYWVAGVVVGHIAGLPAAATITTYLPTYMVMMSFMILCLLAARGIIIMAVDRPNRPLTYLWYEVREVARDAGAPRRCCADARRDACVRWDLHRRQSLDPPRCRFPGTAFEQMERWLHGGVAPWELLQPLLGYPVVTHAINWAYNFWFYFLSLIWVWQAFRQSDNGLRPQFFLTLTLAGSCSATSRTLLSSAGPCYYGRIVGLPSPCPIDVVSPRRQ